MEVVGEAGDGRTAVDMARDLRPGVVVMDVSMPNLNGIDATRQIIAHAPQAKVLALSAHGDRRMVRDALVAGATGYLLKDAATEELVEAIRAVLAGETYLSPRVADTVVQDYARSGGDSEKNARLSPREREVLQLMSEGKATKEVAMALGVSVKTAETHRRSIMEKLHLFSVAELTKHAIREGLTTLDY